MRMQAVHEVSRGMSLNKALRYCGMSKRAWYYVKKPRDVAIDANVADRVRGHSLQASHVRNTVNGGVGC